MKADEDDPTGAHGLADGGEMSEDEIDANLEDTFPASDPPAWTLGTDHRPAPTREPDESE